jgi:hypothetical protein
MISSLNFLASNDLRIMGVVTRTVRPSLSLARAECYMLMLNTNDQFMEEKQKRCKRCHGGTLHATLNPNENSTFTEYCIQKKKRNLY